MTPDVHQATTYVWYHAGQPDAACFFVSTNERDSSATVSPPPRFFETCVWRYCWETKTRGEWLGNHGGGRTLAVHNRIVDSLNRVGTLPADQGE